MSLVLKRIKDAAERPVAYLPLGTPEWHGKHPPLEANALQSEALMLAGIPPAGKHTVRVRLVDGALRVFQFLET